MNEPNHISSWWQKSHRKMDYFKYICMYVYKHIYGDIYYEIHQAQTELKRYLNFTNCQKL